MTELEAALMAAGKRLAAADAERAEAIVQVIAALKAAEGSMHVTEMSRIVGVSRPTIYKLLKKGPT